VLARYVPDFEPHVINVSTLDDAAIQGEVVTRLFVLVLKHIFDHSLGGRLDEILCMASEVIRQPSGMEMVMTLLRYIGRSAVKLDKTEMAQKLLAYLPKEGGALMETMAQEWIDEGFAKGIEQGLAKGKKERTRRTRRKGRKGRDGKRNGRKRRDERRKWHHSASVPLQPAIVYLWRL
jgi:hypothetical protein